MEKKIWNSLVGLVYNYILKSEQVRRLLDSAQLLAVPDKTVTATNKPMVSGIR